MVVPEQLPEVSPEIDPVPEQVFVQAIPLTREFVVLTFYVVALSRLNQLGVDSNTGCMTHASAL